MTRGSPDGLDRATAGSDEIFYVRALDSIDHLATLRTQANSKRHRSSPDETDTSTRVNTISELRRENDRLQLELDEERRAHAECRALVVTLQAELRHRNTIPASIVSYLATNIDHADLRTRASDAQVDIRRLLLDTSSSIRDNTALAVPSIPDLASILEGAEPIPYLSPLLDNARALPPVSHLNRWSFMTPNLSNLHAAVLSVNDEYTELTHEVNEEDEAGQNAEQTPLSIVALGSAWKAESSDLVAGYLASLANHSAAKRDATRAEAVGANDTQDRPPPSLYIIDSPLRLQASISRTPNIITSAQLGSLHVALTAVNIPHGTRRVVGQVRAGSDGMDLQCFEVDADTNTATWFGTLFRAAARDALVTLIRVIHPTAEIANWKTIAQTSLLSPRSSAIIPGFNELNRLHQLHALITGPSRDATSAVNVYDEVHDQASTTAMGFEKIAWSLLRFYFELLVELIRWSDEKEVEWRKVLGTPT